MESLVLAIAHAISNGWRETLASIRSDGLSLRFDQNLRFKDMPILESRVISRRRGARHHNLNELCANKMQRSTVIDAIPWPHVAGGQRSMKRFAPARLIVVRTSSSR